MDECHLPEMAIGLTSLCSPQIIMLTSNHSLTLTVLMPLSKKTVTGGPQGDIRIFVLGSGVAAYGSGGHQRTRVHGRVAAETQTWVPARKKKREKGEG